MQIHSLTFDQGLSYSYSSKVTWPAEIKFDKDLAGPGETKNCQNLCELNLSIPWSDLLHGTISRANILYKLL